MIKGNSARPEKAKGLKRLKLAQIDIYTAIPDAVLSYTDDDRLVVRMNWCSYGVSVKSVSGADCFVASPEIIHLISYNFLYLPIDLCGIDRLSGKIIRVE
ncbi:hypothetical protein [Klebsiella grimontii]|uniref:hypothetical protein n=1 Tax=Klebsiella grimontii TaxID=2058152 RepID=UPI0015ABD57E|nr:hypothetical protein [Klebsiella grimontii]